MPRMRLVGQNYLDKHYHKTLELKRNIMQWLIFKISQKLLTPCSQVGWQSTQKKT